MRGKKTVNSSVRVSHITFMLSQYFVTSLHFFFLNYSGFCLMAVSISLKRKLCFNLMSACVESDLDTRRKKLLF
jgi:hypothetical protein